MKEQLKRISDQELCEIRKKYELINELFNIFYVRIGFKLRLEVSDDRTEFTATSVHFPAEAGLYSVTIKFRENFHHVKSIIVEDVTRPTNVLECHAEIGFPDANTPGHIEMFFRKNVDLKFKEYLLDATAYVVKNMDKLDEADKDE